MYRENMYRMAVSNAFIYNPKKAHMLLLSLAEKAGLLVRVVYAQMFVSHLGSFSAS